MPLHAGSRRIGGVSRLKNVRRVANTARRIKLCEGQDMKMDYIYGVKLQVEDPEQAADWLCDKLFFVKETEGEEIIVNNGGFRFILKNRSRGTENKNAEDTMYLGIDHVALETYDIEKAIEYCKEKGLNPELNEQGGARHSGKVYGTGMSYFNIRSEFGFTVEISQKLHCRKRPTENIIDGLEHVGLQVDDINKAMSFYEKLGFKKEFEPVLNESGGHRIRCCMMSARGTTIEIYEFEDVKGIGRREPAVMEALVIGDREGVPGKALIMSGPAGELVEIRKSCNVA